MASKTGKRKKACVGGSAVADPPAELPVEQAADPTADAAAFAKALDRVCVETEAALGSMERMRAEFIKDLVSCGVRYLVKLLTNFDQLYLLLDFRMFRTPHRAVARGCASYRVQGFCSGHRGQGLHPRARHDRVVSARAPRPQAAQKCTAQSQDGLLRSQHGPAQCGTILSLVSPAWR
jgi:hypothetical protein